MKPKSSITSIASLIGDRARTAVLTALMADRALTATELASIADVTKQTISAHLAKLVDAGLITVESHGRHRYFRLADQDVAHLLETLIGIAFRTGAVTHRASAREPELRRARVCYDHLGGEVGVLIYESLLRRDALAMTDEGLILTDSGLNLFNQMGINTDAVLAQRRALCRPCLDWSERRHHLAGALGAALLARIFELDWARKAKNSRVVSFTPAGDKALWTMFGTRRAERSGGRSASHS